MQFVSQANKKLTWPKALKHKVNKSYECVGVCVGVCVCVSVEAEPAKPETLLRS